MFPDNSSSLRTINRASARQLLTGNKSETRRRGFIAGDLSRAAPIIRHAAVQCNEKRQKSATRTAGNAANRSARNSLRSSAAITLQRRNVIPSPPASPVTRDSRQLPLNEPRRGRWLAPAGPNNNQRAVSR